MKKIIFLFGIIASLCLINFVSAIILHVDVSPVFSENQKIYFNYSIHSDIGGEVIYVPQIICKNVPSELLDRKNITLGSNQEFDGVYEGFIVDNTIISQDCKAIISLIEPVNLHEEKDFKIDTNPSFNFDIKLDKKVFYSGEEININYNSDIENPIISASLTYPDGTKQDITLPTSITATQIGTYDINIIASKEGYKNITKEEQFGVLQKQIGIMSAQGFNDASTCNADGVCNGNENKQNCPQDCPPTSGLQESAIGNKLILYLFIGFLVLILIIIALYLVLNKKRSLKRRRNRRKGK